MGIDWNTTVHSLFVRSDANGGSRWIHNTDNCMTLN
jgi:hypothetical protein